jgi:methyl-accepting chemotaxis protein
MRQRLLTIVNDVIGTDLDDMQVEIDGNSRLISETNAQLAGLHVEIDDISSLIAERNIELDDIQAGIANSNRLIDETNAELDDIQAGISDNRRLIDETNAELDDLQTGIRDNRQLVDEHDIQLEGLQTGIRDTRQLIDETNVELAGLRTGISDDRQLIDETKLDLDTSIAETSQRLSDNTSAITKMADSIRGKILPSSWIFSRSADNDDLILKNVDNTQADTGYAFHKLREIDGKPSYGLHFGTSAGTAGVTSYDGRSLAIAGSTNNSQTVCRPEQGRIVCEELRN